MGDLSISNCNKCGSKCHSCKCESHSHTCAIADAPVQHPMLARRLLQAPAPETDVETNAAEDLVRFVKITSEIRRYEAEMNAMTRERDASIEAVGWVSKNLQQLESLPKLEPPQSREPASQERDLQSREDNLDVESPRPPVQHMHMPEPEPLPLPEPKPKKVSKLKKKPSRAKRF